MAGQVAIALACLQEFVAGLIDTVAMIGDKDVPALENYRVETCRSVVFLGAWEIGYPSIDLTEPALFGYRRKAPTESLAGRLLRKHEVVAERQWVRHQPDNLVEHDYPYLTHDPFLSEPALSLSWGLVVTELNGPNLLDM